MKQDYSNEVLKPHHQHWYMIKDLPLNAWMIGHRYITRQYLMNPHRFH